MITNFNDMLKDAYKGHYAIGSFNAYGYETIRGIIDAGVRTGCTDMIVAFGAKYLTNMSLDEAVAITKAAAQSAEAAAAAAGGKPLRVCLHLDHCKNIDIIGHAIDAGFGSVMYDGSALPFEENLKNTKLVCDMAHIRGVSVEAELGSLAAGASSHEGEATDREVYTDPEAAAEFIAGTGVDALAVSIGTVHGLYKGTPDIRVDILKEINAACGIPLVLHGGSGTPRDKILECIANGISKINVNTEIAMFAAGRLKERLAQDELPHLSVLQRGITDDVCEIVSGFMKEFSAL